MKDCIDCIHWKSTGEEDYQGNCGLYSVTCITAIFNHKTPTNFTNKNESNPVSELKSEGGDSRVKRSTAFPSDKELVKAQLSRQRQTPLYLDMRTLTDKSKKELRKRRRK